MYWFPACIVGKYFEMWDFVMLKLCFMTFQGDEFFEY